MHQPEGKENVLPPSQRTKRTIKVRPQSRPHLTELNPNPTDNHIPTQTVEHEGREKLLELTSQCVSYFHRFATEKDAQLAVVARVFEQIAQKVEAAFGEVIAQAERKMKQIGSFLSRERERLQGEKRRQEEELNGLLKEIQEVHLTRILKEEEGSKEVLAEYAGTLEKFFNVMMQVEKNCYEDSVEECVSFVNNLIREELRTILTDRQPPRVEDFVGSPPSDPCFTFDAHPLDEPSSLFAQSPSALEELRSIGHRQQQQAQRLSSYCALLLNGDPFSGVDVGYSPR